MVQLATSYLEKMKADDSRRISSLAEKLLSEFEQTRLPGKPASLKASVEIEPVTADPPSSNSLALNKLEEIQTATEVPTSEPVMKKNSVPLESTSAATKLIFDRSFWFKWIGTAILGIVLSAVLQQYHNAADGSAGAVRVLFGVVAALTSLAQWYLFRNRLEFWWVTVNAATGIGLGVFHKTLFDTTGWGHENLLLLLGAWIILNFVLGLILLRRTQEKSKESPIIGDGARQNIFLLFLSLALILGAISSVLVIFKKYDYQQSFSILFSISAVLVSLSFLWKKEIPRNFGFITLAIFLLFEGINVAQNTLQSNYSPNYFTLNGIMALVSGVFFISHTEVWKNFGFLMVSGCLLVTGLSGFVADDTTIYTVLLAVFIFFAIPAATFFILRK